MLEKEEAVNASGQQDGTESAAVCISVMLRAMDDGVPKTTKRAQVRKKREPQNQPTIIIEPTPPQSPDRPLAQEKDRQN